MKSRPVSAALVVAVATPSEPAEPGIEISCEPAALPALITSSFDPSVNVKENPASRSPSTASSLANIKLEEIVIPPSVVSDSDTVKLLS